jgi:ligand-binding sensor domain-containing protein
VAQGWTAYTADDGLAENFLSCITVASDGTVWIGAADNWISHFDGTSFTKHTAAHGLVDNEIRSIIEAPDGTIWASTISGISRLSSAE